MKSASKKRAPTIVNLTVKRRYLTEHEVERLMDCARNHSFLQVKRETVAHLAVIRERSTISPSGGSTPPPCADHWRKSRRGWPVQGSAALERRRIAEALNVSTQTGIGQRLACRHERARYAGGGADGNARRSACSFTASVNSARRIIRLSVTRRVWFANGTGNPRALRLVTRCRL